MKKRLGFVVLVLIFLAVVVLAITTLFRLQSAVSMLSLRMKDQEVRLLSLEKQSPQVGRYFLVVKALSDVAADNLSSREIVEISRVILEQCHLHEELGLTPALVFGLMERESAFNPRAISSANAYGLTQVLPTTAEQHLREMGYQRATTDLLLDPIVNVKVGIAELIRLRRYWLAEGVDSWMVVLTSYYWGVRATHILLTRKSAPLPTLEYGKGVLELSDKWREKGL